MSAKLQQALFSDVELNIVEFARKLRNADYSKWEKGQRLPEGLARVDLDSRPMGRLGAVFKNYDYASDLNEKTQSPGIGAFRHLDGNIHEFLSTKNARYKALYKIILDNKL